MLAQGIPLGISFSPTTWFVIAVLLIVAALTISTRRSTAHPRAGVASDMGGEWAMAQARFVEDPRAGAELAQKIVAMLLAQRDRQSRVAAVEQRYRIAADIVARPQATTDELREAFLDLRTVFSLLTAPQTVVDR